MKNLWKFSLLTLVSAAVLTACPTPTPTPPPPPPPGPPAPPPPPATINVAGTVLDSSGAPVSAISVQLNNAGTPATTDVQGKFNFSNVTTPYTLTAKFTSPAAIVEYRGLTRADPLLSSNGFGGITSTASVAGTITGPTFPLPAGNSVIVSGTNGALSGINANTTTAAYTGNMIWGGSATKTTDLVALRTSGSVPTLSYLQTGKRAGVTLTKGIGQTGLNIPLDTAVPSGSTTLNYTLGAYTSSPSAGLLSVRVNSATFLFGSGSIASGTAVSVPNEGSLFSVQGEDAAGNSAALYLPGVAAGVTSVAFPTTVALKNSLPSNGSTGVSKLPTLSWSPVAGADLYVVGLSGPTNYTVFLPGNVNSLTLPDYTTLGANLAGSTAYTLRVTSIQNANFLPNALTDPTGGNILITLYGSTTPIKAFGSASTTFTTAP